MSEDPSAAVDAAPQDNAGAPAAADTSAPAGTGAPASTSAPAGTGAPASTQSSGVGDLLSAAGDLLDTVVTTGAEEVGGVVFGVGNDVLHAVATVADAGRALGHELAGDSAGATHELSNLVADGFEAIPGHELAWDGLAGMGHAIDGPQNQVKMWDDGGRDQFRDGVGADPEHDVPLQMPGEPEIPQA